MTNQEELQIRLNGLLNTFNCPPEKKNDLLWLKENIAVKNTGHRDLPDVQRIVLELLIEKNKNRVKNFLK